MNEQLYTQQDLDERVAAAINSYAAIHDTGLVKGGLIVVGAVTVIFTVCNVVGCIVEDIKERNRYKTYLRKLKNENQR